MQTTVYFDDVCYDIKSNDTYFCEFNKSKYYDLIETILTKEQYEVYTTLDLREFEIDNEILKNI
jgi:hypothetical protein